MLILGTANKKKGLELADLLRTVGVELRTLGDFPGTAEVVENGDSFAANARLKAAGYAKVWADGYWPTTAGWRSTPWAVSRASFRRAIPARTPPMPRTIDCCWTDWGSWSERSGAPASSATWRWPIRRATFGPKAKPRAEAAFSSRRGAGGFGYDPLFEVVEYHRTFAELGLAVKAVLSHRARAVCRVVPQLIALLGELEKNPLLHPRQAE